LVYPVELDDGFMKELLKKLKQNFTLKKTEKVEGIDRSGGDAQKYPCAVSPEEIETKFHGEVGAGR
jgi:hypothetical protein